MKLAYERPMMSAELYQTNAYFSVCDTWRLTGNLSVDNSMWIWPETYQSNSFEYNGKTYYTNHTFTQENHHEVSGNGGTHYYWSCNCTNHTDAGEYFLEYSPDHSVDPNYGGGEGKYVFYIYYDSYNRGNNNNTLQLAGPPSRNEDGPWGDNDSDLVLSRVVVSQERAPVANS